jgi:hypothetical protein
MKLRLGLALLLISVLALSAAGCTGGASGVNLVATMHGCGGSGSGAGEISTDYELDFETTICNKGSGTARDVRVFVEPAATNQGVQEIEVEPRQKQKPVTLEAGECETFVVNWEWDYTGTSNEEAYQLINQYVFHATWTDKNGNQGTAVLGEGSEGSP